MEHYRCVKCYVPTIGRERDADTISFFPKKVNFPKTTTEDYLRQAASDIVFILQNKPSIVPSLDFGDETENAYYTFQHYLDVPQSHQVHQEYFQPRCLNPCILRGYNYQHILRGCNCPYILQGCNFQHILRGCKFLHILRECRHLQYILRGCKFYQILLGTTADIPSKGASPNTFSKNAILTAATSKAVSCDTTAVHTYSIADFPASKKNIF